MPKNVNNIEQLIQQILDKIVPCSDNSCDGLGTTMSGDAFGNYYQDQCQYCHIVRLPLKVALLDLIEQEVTKGRLDELNTVLHKPESLNTLLWTQQNIKDRIAALTAKGDNK